MKDALLKLLPQNRKDVNTYCLIAVALLPLIYIICEEFITYLTLNVLLLFVFCVIFILKITRMVIYKEKTDKFHSLAFIFLFAMFAWVFISSFFALFILYHTIYSFVDILNLFLKILYKYG